METKNIWYVSNGTEVVGPFATDGVKYLINRIPSCQIWRHGESTWVDAKRWLQTNGSAIEALSPIFFLDHERHIPRSLDETLDLVRPATHLEMIRFWMPESNLTKSLFEVPDICEALGLPQRREVRTGLAGVAIIQKNNVRIAASIQTISPSGLGAKLGSEISLSGEVLLSLRSTDLIDIPPVKAEVLYIHNGSVGFKFRGMDLEGKNKIVTYIRDREGVELSA